jgi:hypothetical protein
MMGIASCTVRSIVCRGLCAVIWGRGDRNVGYTNCHIVVSSAYVPLLRCVCTRRYCLKYVSPVSCLTVSVKINVST